MSDTKIIQDKENNIGKNIGRIRKEQGRGQTELVKELQLINIDVTRENACKDRERNTTYSIRAVEGDKRYSENNL